MRLSSWHVALQKSMQPFLCLQASEQVERAVERGWASAQEIAIMSQALQEWSEHPDRFFAQAWCEAIGQKDHLRSSPE